MTEPGRLLRCPFPGACRAQDLPLVRPPDVRGHRLSSSKMPSRQAAHPFAFLFSFLDLSFPVPVAPRCCNTGKRSHLGFPAIWLPLSLTDCSSLFSHALSETRAVSRRYRCSQSRKGTGGGSRRATWCFNELSPTAARLHVFQSRRMSRYLLATDGASRALGTPRSWAATCIDPVRGLNRKLAESGPFPSLMVHRRPVCCARHWVGISAG